VLLRNSVSAQRHSIAAAAAAAGRTPA
jgi:hypothetical protein